MSRRQNHPPRLSLFAFQDIITSVMGIMLLVALLMALGLSVLKANVSTVEENVEEVSVDALEELEQRVRDLHTDVARLDGQLGKEREYSRQAVMSIGELRKVLERLKEEARELNVEIEDARVKSRQLVDPEDLWKRIQSLQRQVDESIRALAELKRHPRVKYLPEEGASKLPIIIEVRNGKVLVQPVDGRAVSLPYRKASDIRSAFVKLGGLSPRAYYVLLLLRPSNSNHADDLIRQARSMGYDYGYEPLREAEIVIEEPESE